MEKYVFCIIAILIQPIFAWLIYHKQDKRKAALKMPMLYFSGAYVITQIYVFWKYCRKFPDEIEMYSYLIQGAILVVFIVIELVLFASNKYIEDIQQKEQDSIREFKLLIRELELCKINVVDAENQRQLNKVLERMRYSDPTSSPAVAMENQRIYDLIQELNVIKDNQLFSEKCDEILKQLEIRKIKNIKEQG